MDDLTQLQLAAEGFASLLRAVGPGDFAGPTPCTSWDVRELVNHVIRGTATSGAAMSGAPEPDRDADYLGEDPAASFEVAFDALVRAAERPGALDAQYPSRRGEVTGRRMIGVRTIEYAVHGWDLAVATGRQPMVDEALVAHCLALDAENSGGRPRGADGPYAPVVEVPASAPASEQLAAHFGRDVVSWPARAAG